MKLSNIFKKSVAKNTNTSITKMDKTQLSKVIGGTETSTRTSSTDNNGKEIKVETPASAGNY